MKDPPSAVDTASTSGLEPVCRSPLSDGKSNLPSSRLRLLANPEESIMLGSS